MVGGSGLKYSTECPAMEGRSDVTQCTRGHKVFSVEAASFDKNDDGVKLGPSEMWR